MEINVRRNRNIVNITAESLRDCGEMSDFIELIKNGEEVNIHIRYDVPPIRLDSVKITKA